MSWSKNGENRIQKSERKKSMKMKIFLCKDQKIDKTLGRQT